MKAILSPLQLKDIQIYNFKLEENLKGKKHFNIDIDFQPVLVNKNNKKEFNGLLVEIQVNNKTKNTKLKLNLKLLAIFEIEEDLNEEKKAKLLIYNGLSIVYGFVRGLVFQKCSFLPYEDRLLPIINLADLIERKIRNFKND